jgi:polyisoprenoid-binding protein YceI
MPFQIDASHSQVQFSVRHMMVSKARGTFDKWSGSIALNPEHPEQTTVEITIDTDSINTKDAQRDGHLKSPDFLAVEQYPAMTFKSTRVEVTGKETAKLYGDLTIRGVSKPVVVDVEYQGSAKSPWGTTNYGFSGSTKINREDWGLNWNAALETGGWLVGKEVQIDIELELVQVAEPAAAA